LVQFIGLSGIILLKYTLMVMQIEIMEPLLDALKTKSIHYLFK
jgi:hypothetical protein